MPGRGSSTVRSAWLLLRQLAAPAAPAATTSAAARAAGEAPPVAPLHRSPSGYSSPSCTCGARKASNSSKCSSDTARACSAGSAGGGGGGCIARVPAAGAWGSPAAPWACYEPSPTVPSPASQHRHSRCDRRYHEIRGTSSSACAPSSSAASGGPLAPRSSTTSSLAAPNIPITNITIATTTCSTAAAWRAHRRAHSSSSSTAGRPPAPAAPDFGSLGVAPDLQARLEALLGAGCAPLPVQAAAVPAVLGGSNVAIKCCTGAGKTLAYLVAVMQLAHERRRAALDALAAATAAAAAQDGAKHSGGGGGGGGGVAALKQAARAVQALIVAPSRELAIQIQRTAQALLPYADAHGGGGPGHASLRGSADEEQQARLPPDASRLVAQAVGGANPKRQAEVLAGGGGVWPLLVVGTPGRLAELVREGTLGVWGTPLLVLDEVDALVAHRDGWQQVDGLCSHVGRRAPPPLPLQQQQQQLEGGAPRPPLRGGGAAASAPAQGGSGGGGGAGAGGGEAAWRRQTILVSASLSATPQGLARYAAWCPDPLPVVIAPEDALPAAAAPQLPQWLLRKQQHVAAEGAAAAAAPDGAPPASASPAAAGGAEAASSPSAPPATAPPPTQAPPTTTRPPTPPPPPGGAAPGAVTAGMGSLRGVLPPHLQHLVVLCASEHRTDAARRAIHALDLQRCLLFVNRARHVMVTMHKLNARNMGASVLHGGLSKLERGNISAAFRAGDFRALVATDLGSRGLDVPDCDAVLHLGPPPDALAYSHRAGRTGRAGAPGVVVSVVTRHELPKLHAIAGQLGVRLQTIAIAHGTVAPVEEAEMEAEAEAEETV